MKKVYLLPVIIFCISFVFNADYSYSQTKFSSYINSYSGRTYDLKVSGNPDSYIVWIELMSYDKFNEQGSIMLDTKQYSDFVTCLAKAKQKYEEWLEKVRQINDNESGEILEIPFKAKISFRYGTRWWRSGEVNLSWTLKAIPKSDQQQPGYLLKVGTGMLHPSNNMLTTHVGFGLVFKSASEIQSLLDELTLEKIQTAIRNQN